MVHASFSRHVYEIFFFFFVTFELLIKVLATNYIYIYISIILEISFFFFLSQAHIYNM